MSITREDYHRALSRFVSDIARLEDDIACVMLYGSMARGDMRVGESDMDICVFIRKETFEARERFLSVLQTIVEASNTLLESGLPFQRCHYYSEDELNSLDAKFVSIWGGNETSKIVFGEDIRSRIASSEAGRFIASTVFFEGRRILLPLSIYLRKAPLAEQDCAAIINDLLAIRKAVVQSACNAFGVWPDTSDAVEKLERLIIEGILPDINIEGFKRLDELRGHKTDDLDAEYLREILKEVLMLIETLNERIITRMDSTINT